jgi:hypothetical protein
MSKFCFSRRSVPEQQDLASIRLARAEFLVPEKVGRLLRDVLTKL